MLQNWSTIEKLKSFLSSTSLVIKIIKAWIIQANSFGISFSGLTLRPYLSRGFPFDTYIVQNKTLFFNRELSFLVGTTGFEPAAFCSQSRRDTKLRYVPISFIALVGALERIRTPDFNIRSVALYPTELLAHDFCAI